MSYTKAINARHRLEVRLEFAGEAGRVIWDWIGNDCHGGEWGLASTLMQCADSNRFSTKDRTERCNEATRLIRDIYMTDRKPSSILLAVRSRAKKAKKRLRCEDATAQSSPEG